MNKFQIILVGMIITLVATISVVSQFRYSSLEARAMEAGYVPGNVDEFGHVVVFYKDGVPYGPLEIQDMVRKP